MNWLRNYWYVAVIAALLLLNWWQGRRIDHLAQTTTAALTHVGRDSTIVKTQIVTVEKPTLIDNVLKTEDYKRYQAELKKHIDAQIAEILKAQHLDPSTVTVVNASLPGDTSTFRFGEVRENKLYALDIPAPSMYRLVLKPRPLSINVVETKNGTLLASAHDLALDRPVQIDRLSVTRVVPGWRTRWFPWEVGVGIGQGFEEKDQPKFAPSIAMSLLRRSRGDVRWDVMRLDADPYRVRVDVLRVAR